MYKSLIQYAIAISAMCGFMAWAQQPALRYQGEPYREMSHSNAMRALRILEKTLSSYRDIDADVKAALSCCGPLEEIAACVALIKEEVIELQSQLESCCESIIDIVNTSTINFESCCDALSSRIDSCCEQIISVVDDAEVSILDRVDSCCDQTASRIDSCCETILDSIDTSTNQLESCCDDLRSRIDRIEQILLGNLCP